MNQNSLIVQDSYWFINGEDEDATVSALCVVCSKKENKGWVWQGTRLGYGDYDLFCKSCGNAIHLRKENVENKTDNKNKPQ